MKPPLSVFVPGTPVAQPRPRAVIRGRHAGVYDPGTADKWKSQIRKVVTDATGGTEPFPGPVRLSLTFYMPRPKSHYRTNGMLKPSAPAFNLTRPDLDNTAKATMDALTTAQVWNDDAQVCTLIVRRRWADGQPGCQVTIREDELPHAA